MAFSFVQPDPASLTTQRGFPVTGSAAGPFANGTDIYLILNSDDATTLIAWKSTDGGATWTSVSGPTDVFRSQTDFYGTFFFGGTYAAYYASAVIGTVIYVAYWIDSGSNIGTTLRFTSYDMSTDTWATSVTGPTISLYSPFSGESSPLGLIYRPSDGNLVLLCSGDAGASALPVQFFVFDTSWSTVYGPATVLSVYGYEFRACLSHSGGSYWINVFGSDLPASYLGTLHHRTIKDDNTLGTDQTLGTFGTAPLQVFGQSWTSMLSGPQYGWTLGVPYAKGADIIHPIDFICTHADLGSAYQGFKALLYRANAAHDPTWSTDFLVEWREASPSSSPSTFNPTIQSGPITYGRQTRHVACEDGGSLCLVMANSDDILTAAWTGSAWADAVVQGSDFVGGSPPEAGLWAGDDKGIQTEGYLGANVVPQGLDIIIGWQSNTDGQYGTYRIGTTLLPGTPLAGGCGSPPSGTVCSAYSHTFPASGGVAPYTFAITAGALPTGLSLNTSTGVVSGTPSSVDTFSFTIEVTDSASSTVDTDCSITISCPGAGTRGNVFY